MFFQYFVEMMLQVTKVIFYHKMQWGGIFFSYITRGRFGLCGDAFDDMAQMMVVCRP